MSPEKGTIMTSPLCQIKTQVLLSVYPLKGDVFIKIGERYIKLFHQGDVFSQADFTKYTEEKGLEFLYIEKSLINEFSLKLSDQVQKQASQTPVQALDQLFPSSKDIYETVQEMSQHVGFSKEVQTLVKTHVKAALYVMGKMPNLNQVLTKLDKFKGEYLSAHSSLTGYLACSIASHIGWGSEPTFHKLILAGFLHDIVFQSSQLAKCKTPDQARKEGFSLQEIELVAKHPEKTAELARTFSEVPPDVDSIIFQHHEEADGTGFPKKINHAYISPMSAVFQIAHRMADEILASNGERYSVADFAKRNKELYPGSKFRKIFDILEKSLVQYN